MTSVSSVEPKKSKKSAGLFFLWWKTDPGEVERQARGYSALSVWQSARGNSALLCLLTVTVTFLLGRFVRLSPEEIIGEAIVWLTLGFFMYRGHRWAFILGMILWTLEKATLLVEGVSAAPIVQVIWWAIYMNAFFLGYKVESRRAALPVIPKR
jgi:hypothetical protein